LHVFLHFLGWSSVLLIYGIAWELTNKHLFAFICGTLAALWPEYIYFNNLLLTEAPSGFFNILALYAALKYMRRQSILCLYITFLSATFAVLIRSEYLLIFFVFGLFLLLSSYWKKRGTTLSSNQYSKIVWSIVISFLIASLPILFWSYRNYQYYNFFGLTSYTGDVLYDGFVVAGNALGIPVMDKDSPAVKSLKEAHIKDKAITVEKGQPWPEWREYGVNTYNDGMSLMKFSGAPWTKTVSPILKRAALDSIISHPYNALRLAVKKVYIGLKESYWTVGWLPDTGHMPGEPETSTNGWVETYGYVFQSKPGVGDYLSFNYIPSVDFIKTQRSINSIYISHTRSVYFATWRYLALLGFILCLYCRPFLSWALFLAVTFNMVIIPFALGYPLGRYGVSGGLLLIILFSAVIRQLSGYFVYFCKKLFPLLRISQTACI
jgi:hypothetical protein